SFSTNVRPHDSVYSSRSTVHGARSTSLAPPLPRSPAPSVAVLVAGGFHTAPITTLLREKNISYLVITPHVERLTPADHDLYVKRLSGQLLTVEDILADAKNIGTVPEGPFHRFWANFWPSHKSQKDGLAAGIFLS